MVCHELVIERISEVARIARWWFTSSPRMRRLGMAAGDVAGGGIQDVVNETILASLKELGRGKVVDVELSTYVCKRATWTALRLLKKRPRVATIPIVLQEHDMASEACDTDSHVDAIDVSRVFLRLMTYREREVIKARLGIGQSALTLKEVGNLFRLSRERVRQIEAKAILRCSGLPAAHRVRRMENSPHEG